MILKKPYGLLIKHFKFIHLILTALAIYIATQTRIIVNFFHDYVANDYYVNIFDNMADSYISILLYVAIVLALIMLLAIFILLRYKRKPNTFYIIAMIYYIILIIMVLISANLINSLGKGFFETAAARQYRDISTMLYWPQMIIIVVLGVRTLGFNVKQFNFQSDIKELDLAAEDSELIEINLGFDTTKAKRNIRRLGREFKYYFKENKFMIIIVLLIGAVILTIGLTRSHEKLKFNYNQGQAFNYAGFNISVADSILTNLSYEGKKVNEDNYYLLVKVNVTNNNKDDTPLDYTNFRIYLENDSYIPSLNIGSLFIDYAKPYYGENIKSGDTKTYLLAYAIGKEKLNQTFNITIYNGSVTKKNKYAAKNIIVKLNPAVLDQVSIINEYALNDTLTFDNTYLNKTTLKITDYLITNSYTFKYQDKYNDKTKEYTGYVTANSSGQNKNTLLVLGYEFYLDPTSAYYASAKSINSFFQSFVKIRYEFADSVKIIDALEITPSLLKNKIVFQIPKEIEEADKVQLYIMVRNKSYIINLK